VCAVCVVCVVFVGLARPDRVRLAVGPNGMR
jgi:hypothetical protein